MKSAKEVGIEPIIFSFLSSRGAFVEGISGGISGFIGGAIIGSLGGGAIGGIIGGFSGTVIGEMLAPTTLYDQTHEIVRMPMPEPGIIRIPIKNNNDPC